MNHTPNAETYDALDRAFAHFNAALFDNRLETPMFTLTRKRGAHGYFWGSQWVHRDDGSTLPEIALNPHTMGRPLRETLSTLVHEMVHLEQEQYGTPGKSGHNEEWAKMMDRIGLTPTSTGEEGGKRTGRKVTHMIVDGGPYDNAYEDLICSGFALPWHGAPPPEVKKKDPSKVKFCCPTCGAAAWGKQSLRITCSDCEEEML